MTNPTVKAVQPIQSYEGPQWRVTPCGGNRKSHLSFVRTEGEVVVLDRNVQGWGKYNAIIRVTFEGWDWQDYLALIEEDAS